MSKRVLVVGPSCSGKTTLGARIAARLAVPHIDLDALFWLPGWREPETEDFREKVRTAIADLDGWVVTGNYNSRQEDITWPLADTAVWLDLPLGTTVPRILRRSWRRSRSGEVLWGTNRERFWPQLKVWSPKESLIGWSVTHHKAQVERFERLMAVGEFPNLTWVRMKSSAEAEAWLASLPAAAPASV